MKCRGSKILQSETETLQLFLVVKYEVKVKTQERLHRIKNGVDPTFPPFNRVSRHVIFTLRRDESGDFSFFLPARIRKVDQERNFTDLFCINGEVGSFTFFKVHMNLKV